MKTSLAGLLTVALIIIKILKLAPISWWWVFSPIWIFWALSISVFGCFFAGFILFYLLKNFIDK